MSGKIRKPEIHPDLWTELTKLDIFQSQINEARKQIVENAIQINVLQSTIDFGVNGGYFTDDLSNIEGTPIETGIFDNFTNRFIMP